MAKVSVILTSFNHENFLAESIDSILAQTYIDYELFIVDDCSTDSSWEIIHNYHDPRIHAIRHETNWGAGVIEDVVKHYATGDFVAIAHSDDKWAPQKLEKQLAYLEAAPTCAACFTLVTLIDESGQTVADESHFYGTAFNQSNRNRFEMLRTAFYDGCKLCHPTLLIRREAYTSYGIFTKGLHSIPDFCQWIRLCLHADIFILQERLAYFRIRDNGINTSGDNALNHYRSNTELYFVLREFEKITDPITFLQVFPEAIKYLPETGGLVPFAYARILLDTSSLPQYRLYGLTLLYALMQNDSTRSVLAEQYGYRDKDFDKEKQETDIFSIIPDTRFLNCRLYIDYGEGFNDNQCLIAPKVYVNNNQNFTVEFLIDNAFLSRPVTAIRFDPDEGYPRKFSTLKAYADDLPLSVEAVNSIQVQDGWDVFASTDPQYILSLPQTPIKHISVCGKTQLLSCQEAESLLNYRINILYQNVVAKQKDVQELRSALTLREHDNSEFKYALGVREKDIQELRSTLSLKEHDISEFKCALGVRENDIQELRSILTLREHDISEFKCALGVRENDNIELRSALSLRESDIMELKNGLSLLNESRNELCDVISQRENGIEELKSVLELRERDLYELRTVLSLKETDIRELKTCLDVKEEDIAELRTSLAIREQDIAEFRSALDIRERDILELREAISHKDSIIEELSNQLSMQGKDDDMQPSTPFYGNDETILFKTIRQQQEEIDSLKGLLSNSSEISASHSKKQPEKSFLQSNTKIKEFYKKVCGRKGK